MKLINADELYYEDIECTDGNIYSVVHAPEIDNADIFDLEAHNNVVIKDFANKIRNYLSDIENKIVKERNKPQSSADKIRLVSMQACIEDFLGWLDDNLTIDEYETQYEYQHQESPNEDYSECEAEYLNGNWC